MPSAFEWDCQYKPGTVLPGDIASGHEGRVFGDFFGTSNSASTHARSNTTQPQNGTTSRARPPNFPTSRPGAPPSHPSYTPSVPFIGAAQFRGYNGLNESIPSGVNGNVYKNPYIQGPVVLGNIRSGSSAAEGQSHGFGPNSRDSAFTRSSGLQASAEPILPDEITEGRTPEWATSLQTAFAGLTPPGPHDQKWGIGWDKNLQKTHVARHHDSANGPQTQSVFIGENGDTIPFEAYSMLWTTAPVPQSPGVPSATTSAADMAFSKLPIQPPVGSEGVTFTSGICENKRDHYFKRKWQIGPSRDREDTIKVGPDNKIIGVPTSIIYDRETTDD